MSRHVALFQGINVGGRNRLAMAELRRLFESLGLTEVVTLVQSGNVVFGGAEPATLHVGFLPTAPSARVRAMLEADRFRPEAFAVLGREIYLCLPYGMARTKVPAYLDRRLGVRSTIRNWNTVTKLAELAAG